MTTTLSKKIGESFATLNVLKYEHKKISSKSQDMDDVLDDILKNVDRLKKRLLDMIQGEKAVLEQMEHDISESDDKEYLVFLIDMILPTHKVRKELYNDLQSHPLAKTYESVIHQLGDVNDYSDEVINDIKLKISLLDNHLLEEIDNTPWH